MGEEELGHHLGWGTRFRHEGGVVDLLLPDGITSTGSTQKEVVLALCHYNVGTLHGSQLSCVGGMSRRWGLETEERQALVENFGLHMFLEITGWILTGMETLLPAVKRAPASKPPSTITVEPGWYMAPMG